MAKKMKKNGQSDQHVSVLDDREENGAEEQSGGSTDAFGETQAEEHRAVSGAEPTTDELKGKWHDLMSRKSELLAELATVKDDESAIEHELGKRLAAKGKGSEATMPDGNRYRAKKEKGGSRYTLQRAPVGHEVEF